MSALVIFFINLVIFLVLAGISYSHIRKGWETRIQELESRSKALEESWHRTLKDVENERAKRSQAETALEEVSRHARERETLFRQIMPARSLTPLDVLRSRKQVSDADIQVAKETIIKSQALKDVEDVLLEWRKIDEHQLNEARALAERYNVLRASRQGN